MATHKIIKLFVKLLKYICILLAGFFLLLCFLTYDKGGKTHGEWSMIREVSVRPGSYEVALLVTHYKKYMTFYCLPQISLVGLGSSSWKCRSLHANWSDLYILEGEKLDLKKLATFPREVGIATYLPEIEISGWSKRDKSIYFISAAPGNRAHTYVVNRDSGKITELDALPSPQKSLKGQWFEGVYSIEYSLTTCKDSVRKFRIRPGGRIALYVPAARIEHARFSDDERNISGPYRQFIDVITDYDSFYRKEAFVLDDEGTIIPNPHSVIEKLSSPYCP